MKNKNLRKLGSVILSTMLCLMLLIPNVSAATSVSVALTDLRDGVLTVSGTVDGAQAGDKVSILVLNPGCTTAQAVSNSSAIQHQYVVETNESGAFTHTFMLNLPVDFESGEFSVYVGGELFSETYYKPYTFSSFTKRLEYAKELYAKVTADGIEADTDEGAALKVAAATYLEDTANLLGVTDAFYEVSEANIIEDLIAYYNNNSIDFGEGDEEFVREAKEVEGINALVAQIDRLSVLEAFRTGKAEVLFNADNEIVVDDIIGLTEILAANTSLDEIIADIDDEGLQAINESLLEQEIDDENDLAKIYAKSIILYGIKNNTKLGFAYVSDILTEENAEYAGLEIPTYLDLRSTDEADAKIVEHKSSITASNLESKIEDYSEKEEKKDKNNKGNSSSSSSVSVTKPITTPVDENTNSNVSSNEVFTDIASHAWAKDAILSLNSRGIIAGVGGKSFQPAGALTREQAVKIICLALNLDASAADDAVFADEESGAWYQRYLAIARGNGIINGQGENRFGIGNAISREEFATMLYRALKAEADGGELQFADAADISDYSKDAIAYFTDRKIINGYEDGTFKPKASINRAEAAKLVYELLNRGDA